MPRRSDTTNKPVSRSQRIFQEEGSWFFHTREGTMGPFADQLEACTRLETYIRLAHADLLSEPEQEAPRARRAR